jgi:hypothetical protein
MNPFQRLHQSKWCRKEYDRVRSGWRFIGRSRKPRIEPPPQEPELIDNPLKLARWHAWVKYRWVLVRHLQDALQTLYLALLEHGIREFEDPTMIDVRALLRRIDRHLYGLARAMGARYDRHSSGLNLNPDGSLYFLTGLLQPLPKGSQSQPAHRTRHRNGRGVLRMNLPENVIRFYSRSRGQSQASGSARESGADPLDLLRCCP